MRLFKQETRIDFVSRGKRLPALVLSVLLVVGSLAALGVKGLNFGIDFTGGFLVEVGYPEAVELSTVRGALEEEGFESAIVTTFGSDQDILIRLGPEVGAGEEAATEAQARVSDQVLQALRAQNSDVEMRRVEFVGPQVGAELVDQGAKAVLFALIGILIYVAFRFQYKMAPGAIFCLIHDVILVLGIFALTQVQFDLSVLAAILAVIGYSLNDTIVLFDRIRENFPRIRKAEAVEITNTSVNQMLARTVVTSLTTLLVLVSLLSFGGETIYGFALALTFGVVVGTYSSIYIAGTTLIFMGLTREDLLPPKKEGEEAESPPFQG